LALRSSLSELVAAAVAAIEPRRGDFSPNPAEPLSPLYALANAHDLAEAESTLHYPTSISEPGARGLPHFETLFAWRALLRDICVGTRPGLLAARFLIAVLDGLDALVARSGTTEVALSGPPFARADFRRRLRRRLERRGVQTTVVV
jgi:hypothetical protein